MSKSKLQILYIIIVSLLLIIFSNRTYTRGGLNVIVPVITVSLGIGVIGVYLFGKDMKLHKNLHFISYVLTIGFAFVPVIGVYIVDGTRSYGFPAQWFIHYMSGYVNLQLTGFLFNYYLFYFILLFISKIALRFSNNDLN